MANTALRDSDVARLRAETPGADNRIHLNHAGSSLPSEATLNRQLDHLRREASIGGYEAAAEVADETAQVYDTVAKLLNAAPDEIARLEHATLAWNAAFWSIPMRPGQRILTAEAAYGANAVGFLRAVERHGIAIDVVPSDDTGQVDVDELANRIDDDVALIALTHIPTNGGLVNPAGAVGALANDAGILYLLDACQSVGHLHLDVDALGCDFLSATGRKYLRGPRGTGFLYARASTRDRVRVDHPDHHGVDWNRSNGYAERGDARRYEHWEFSHAGWLSLGVAVDEAVTLGTDRIEATIRARATELRSSLHDAGLPTFDLGIDPAGIVTTLVPQQSAEETKALLADVGINVSTTSASSTRWDAERRGLDSMVRLSVHYLTTREEIRAATMALSR